MDERIDAFLKDVQELEGVPASAIRDGVRSYLAIYENLVRDTEPDPKSREEAARIGVSCAAGARANRQQPPPQPQASRLPA